MYCGSFHYSELGLASRDSWNLLLRNIFSDSTSYTVYMMMAGEDAYRQQYTWAFAADLLGHKRHI